MTPYDPAYRVALQGASHFLVQQGSSASQALAQAQGLVYGNLIRQSTMLAFIDSFWLLGLTFIGMIPLMFLMKKAKPHAATPPAAH